MRAPAHLAHEPLLLHLAAEVPKSLLELSGILYDDAHSPTRIPVSRPGPFLHEDIGPDLAAAGAQGLTPLRVSEALWVPRWSTQVTETRSPGLCE